MRSLIILILFILSTQAFAAPTYHDLAEGLAVISDANNMSDMTPTFLVCFDSGVGFTPSSGDQFFDSRQVLTASVFIRLTDGYFTSTRKKVYSITTDPWWSLQSLNLLGQELLDEPAEMVCSNEALAYQF